MWKAERNECKNVFFETKQNTEIESELKTGRSTHSKS